MSRTAFVFAVAPFVILTAGCDDTDERLARFAQESARQQAEQNREMAQLNREVARSHQELISLERDLEKQQAQIDSQRDGLESERRELAKQRQRDPIIAAAINNVGVILACLLPLALAGYLLYCFRDQKKDQLVTEILIQEMVSERPTLLPPPQAETAAIADQRKPTPPLIAQADADQEKNLSE
jgi:TolA-binding protein